MGILPPLLGVFWTPFWPFLTIFGGLELFRVWKGPPAQNRRKMPKMGGYFGVIFDPFLTIFGPLFGPHFGPFFDLFFSHWGVWAANGRFRRKNRDFYPPFLDEKIWFFDPFFGVFWHFFGFWPKLLFFMIFMIFYNPIFDIFVHFWWFLEVSFCHFCVFLCILWYFCVSLV